MLEDVVISGSESPDDGGAIIQWGEGNLTINNSRITGNTSGDNGGAIYSRGTNNSTNPTAPMITAPANITIEGNTTGGATQAAVLVDLGNVTATDDLNPNPTITNDAPAVFPIGSTTVTFTATDDSGNDSTTTATVTVRNTAAPLNLLVQVASLPDTGQTLRVIKDPTDEVTFTTGDFAVTGSTIEDGVVVIEAASASATIEFTGSQWTNPINPSDVTGDGNLSASDVLRIINFLNARVGGPEPMASGEPAAVVTAPALSRDSVEQEELLELATLSDLSPQSKWVSPSVDDSSAAASAVLVRSNADASGTERSADAPLSESQLFEDVIDEWFTEFGRRSMPKGFGGR